MTSFLFMHDHTGFLDACKAVKQYIAFFSSSAWSALYSNSMILSSSCKAIRTLTHSFAFRGWNCLSELVQDFLIHLKTINQKPCHSARCTVAASFTFSLSSPISMSWKDQHNTRKHTQRGKLKPVSISFLQLWTQIFECSTYFLHQKTLLLLVCLPPSPSRRWAIQTHLNSVDEGRRKILDKGQVCRFTVKW